MITISKVRLAAIVLAAFAVGALVGVGAFVVIVIATNPRG